MAYVPGAIFQGFQRTATSFIGSHSFQERINRGGEAHVLMNERATLYRLSAPFKEESSDAGPHFINATQMVSGNQPLPSNQCRRPKSKSDLHACRSARLGVEQQCQIDWFGRRTRPLGRGAANRRTWQSPQTRDRVLLFQRRAGSAR